MPKLQVDLQEAFLDDLVVICINGEEVCRNSFRTRFQVGLAGSLSFELASGPTKYSIELPEKGVSYDGEVSLESDKYLGVTLGENGSLGVRESDELFRYV